MAASSTRKNKREQAGTNHKSGLTLKKIEALTDTQDIVFEEFAKGQHLNLHGYAGTGKSFLSIYLALQSIERKEHKRLAIFRSAVASRKVGFLPGDEKEKMAVFEAPYKAIFSDLYDRADAYGIMKINKQIEFNSTSFERGNTYDDTIIVVDECQSMSWNELNTLCTRVGENTRIIFCGDMRQTDFQFEDERSGHRTFYEIIKLLPDISSIEFKVEDIVRSGFCKMWIEASIKYEEQNNTSLLRLV